jgi:hypothetical protein
MKKDSLTLKIVAGVLAALMIIPIVAATIMYFLQ